MSHLHDNNNKPDWYAEKNAVNPDWYAEKNAVNPDWYAEKNAVNPEKHSAAGVIAPIRPKKVDFSGTVWLIIGGSVFAVLLLILAGFLLLSSGKNVPLANPVVLIGSTPGPEIISNTVVSSTNTPTVSQTTNSGAPNLPQITTDVSVIENAVYSLGFEAFKNRKLEDAQKILESIKPDEKNYREANKLLFNVYFDLGRKLLTETSENSLELAQKVMDYFGKANTLNPDNSELKPFLDKATLYFVGRTEVERDLCGIALERFRLLYDKDKAYRDATEIYYNCLVKLGRAELDKPNSSKANWQQALDYYNTARGLQGITDKTSAENGYIEADLRINPPPTPTPQPTPTPRPVPTAPPNPCSSGGNGSNFFPYRAAGVGNSGNPDQGKGNIGGSIVDRNGRGIAGATVVVSSGGYSFSATTSGNGSYQTGAILGRATWTVRVVSTPGRTLCFSSGGSVFIDGQAGNFAEVSFTESTP